MAKILIVDDEEHIRYLYSEELSESGYEVITADSGYRLLERIEDEFKFRGEFPSYEEIDNQSLRRS